MNSPMGDQSLTELQHLRNNLVHARQSSADEEQRRRDIQQQAIQHELMSLKEEENRLDQTAQASSS